MSAPVRLLGAIAVSAMAAACGSDSVTAPSTTPTSPTTQTWTSQLTPGGAQARAVTTTQAGTITLTLVGAEVPMTIGIGVPRLANGGCRLTMSQYADSPNTSIAAAVETGDYCVAIFDERNLVPKQATFTAQVIFP